MLLVLLLAGCCRQRDDVAGIPPFPREFRAAWVATVANIDWPSKPALAVEQQQAEMRAILDRAAELKLNAIILQVRTSCDAFYASPLEPWSEYLTGRQGQAPEPMYDPLALWVDEAHKRGIELHAWFNPYRARAPGAKTPDAPNHVSNAKPQIVRRFNGYEWLDPAEEEARKQTLAVFRDVVKRYDVDGVHIDDYFYPYPDYLKGQDFPDEAPWQKYVADGGKLSRADWRRENVNKLIKAIYRETKREKAWVKFGISPFGIWRPGNPAGVAGFDQYDKLYADAKLWLNQGWCDYLTPQLYWRLDAPKQPYARLLAWWIGENYKGRHIWAGNGLSRLSAKEKAWDAQEILDQVAATRRLGAGGNVYFSMKALMADRGGIVEKLEQGPYAQPALPPASPWLHRSPPRKPGVAVAMWDQQTVLMLRPRGNEPPWLWTVYVNYGSAEWRFDVRPGHVRELAIPDDPQRGRPQMIAVAAVDRCGNESARRLCRINIPAQTPPLVWSVADQP